MPMTFRGLGSAGEAPSPTTRSSVSLLTGSISRLAKLAAGLPPERQAQMMDDAFQPRRPPRPEGAKNSVRKPLGEDLPAAEHGITTEPSGYHQELHVPPRQWQIIRTPLVAAVNAPRNRAA